MEIQQANPLSLAKCFSTPIKRSDEGNRSSIGGSTLCDDMDKMPNDSITKDEFCCRMEHLGRHEKVRRKFEVQVGTESISQDISFVEKNQNSDCLIPAKLKSVQHQLKMRPIGNLETPTRFGC